MATFSELLTRIFQPLEVKNPPDLDGEWEPLKTDFGELDSETIWSHGVDDFSDCLLSTEFDEVHRLNIVILRPKFEWSGHQLKVITGRELHRVLVPMSGVPVQAIYSAVVQGIAQCRRSWKACKYCRQTQPSVYMHARDVCMGCAVEYLGVIY